MESHEFEVDKSIIIHLIKSQAGTLGKGVLETIMNSVDAGASKVEIQFDANTLTIVDDGHGLRSRDEILAVFKRFGFDHSNHKREFGKFGLGRGQLWNWCSSTWRTNQFLLDVDVRDRGLKWDLHSDLEQQDGLIITAPFYEPLTAVERSTLQSELERLCRYSTVPVIVNGVQISKDPGTQKWDFETESAYMRVTEGHHLTVYNQGVLVADLYAGHEGIAGVICTKRGYNLTLNIARNDIQRKDCAIWKEISALCRKQANERLSKPNSKRMTDAERTFLATQTADPAHIEHLEKPIFTLTDGKHITFGALRNRLVRSGMALSVADTGNRMAESMMRDKTTVVLSKATLSRFGVVSVCELLDLLEERTKNTTKRWDGYSVGREGRRFKVYEDLSEAPGFKQLNANKIPHDKLTKQQRSFLSALDSINWMVVTAMKEVCEQRPATREIVLGTIEGGEAFTDGTSYIAFTPETAAESMRSGMPGFLRAVHLLVHEYLHNTEDSGSHAHDLDFMEAFHNIVLDNFSDLNKAARHAFKKFVKTQGKLTRPNALDLDLLDTSDASAAQAAEEMA